VERFERQLRSDCLYRPPQWRPGGDARFNELCGYGLVPAATYSYAVAARDAAGNMSPDSAKREHHDRERS